jgi:hypothetical protein
MDESEYIKKQSKYMGAGDISRKASEDARLPVGY